MAITKRVRVLVRAHADGESSSFDLDLLLDPYWIGEESVKGYGGRITNWFADPDIKHGAVPVGVVVIDGAIAASINGVTITVTVPVLPDGALYEVTLGLVFA